MEDINNDKKNDAIVKPYGIVSGLDDEKNKTAHKDNKLNAENIDAHNNIKGNGDDTSLMNEDHSFWSHTTQVKTADEHEPTTSPILSAINESNLKKYLDEIYDEITSFTKEMASIKYSMAVEQLKKLTKSPGKIIKLYLK